MFADYRQTISGNIAVLMGYRDVDFEDIEKGTGLSEKTVMDYALDGKRVTVKGLQKFADFLDAPLGFFFRDGEANLNFLHSGADLEKMNDDLILENFFANCLIEAQKKAKKAIYPIYSWNAVQNLSVVIGANINSAMHAAGFSYEGLSKKSGIPEMEVYDIVNSQSLPTFAQLQAIAQSLGVSIDFLLNMEDDTIQYFLKYGEGTEDSSKVCVTVEDLIKDISEYAEQYQ